MQPLSRKLITIVTESVIEKGLLAALDALGVSGYTIADVRGRGDHGVRNTGWEHGENIRIEVVCDDELAEKVSAHLKENYYSNFAMILFISDVVVLRSEKFH